MNEESVARFFHLMLSHNDIESKADVRDYPIVARALEHSSKNGGKNLGKPDAVAFSSGIYIVMEYKHHTKNQVSYDWERAGPEGYKLSSYWNDIKNKAENGAVHYLIDMVTNSNGTITEGFAVGASMDDDESYIIRPYYYRENMEHPVRLPCMIDFSDFRHNRIRRLKEYAMSIYDGSANRLFDTSNILGEFDSIASRGKIADSNRPFILALALAAMANQRFSPTLLLGNDDGAIVLRHAMRFLDEHSMFKMDVYERIFKENIVTPEIGRSIKKCRSRKEPSILRQICECLVRIPVSIYGKLLDEYVTEAYGMNHDAEFTSLHLANLMMQPTGSDHYLNPCCFMDSDLGFVYRAMNTGGSRRSEPNGVAYSEETFLLSNIWALLDRNDTNYLYGHYELGARVVTSGRGKPSVIVANLVPYFHDYNVFMNIVPTICEQLRKGGRAAFVIPWDVMTSNRRDDAKARDVLMHRFRLDAVVRVSESDYIVCIVNSKPSLDHKTILYDAVEEGIRPLTCGQMFFSRSMSDSDHWARTRLESTDWWKLEDAVSERKRYESIMERVCTPKQLPKDPPVDVDESGTDPEPSKIVFHIDHYGERIASGTIEDDGFRVLKGSKIVPRGNIQRQTIRDSRRDLKNDGTIRNNRFQKDWLSKSVRAATLVVIGSDYNSPLDKWVTEDGRKVREFIRQTGPNEDQGNNESVAKDQDPVFVLNYHGREVARGIPTEGNGFRVLAGSELLPKTRHLVRGNEREYDRLISEGIVVDGRFVKDWDASSPSRAVSVVLGSNYSGLPMWKLEDGTSLKEYLGQE